MLLRSWYTVPSTDVRNRIIRSARTIVVKIGTAALSQANGTLHARRISALARQIAELRRRKREVVLVSSGAIGAGVSRAGLPHRPTALPSLQAVAAIGQPALMSLYDRTLARHGLHAAQILVTRSDFESRQRYLNIRNTIHALHELNAVPLINENDTVAVEEIRFGENDIIAAQIANLLRADLTILLTVVQGLLDNEGKLVEFVPSVGDEVLRLANRQRSSLGTGGMITKLQAVRIVTQAGEAAMIADAREPNVLLRILDGEKIGTVFAPAAKKMSSRQRWIGMTVQPAGRILVDEGAAAALRRGGKSLLASGIVAVEGMFKREVVVDVVDTNGQRIARGITNYASKELTTIKGLKTSHIEQVLGEKPFDEVIHRDDLVLLAE
ncbi:MAG: glutamate 5-kinase [Phycisphaerae bacterium]|nr:glutamate 5-kinase [Phycisphaerae bacterium]